MAEVAKVEKKVQDLFKPEIKELNPWLSPTFSKVDSLGGEPGFKVDDIPERLGLLQKGEGFSSETYYFSDLEGTPDDYGIKNQFLQTDGKSKLRWAWPFWSKAGSTVYYKSGKVAIGHAAAKTIFHIAKGEETIASRISCKVSPWRQWECLDSDYGFALGIAADDKKFHFHYDTPMGTVSVHLMCLDALNSRVGIFQDSPSYPFDVGGNTRIQGTLGSGKLTVDSGVAQSIIIKGTSTGDANLGWIGFYDSDGTTRRGHIGDGSSNDDDIYIGADTGYLRLLAAGYISLGTHTYFPDDVVMSFGASLDYSVGYAQATDTLQIVDGTTLGSNVRLKLDSSGHFDFGAGNLSTTGTLGAGQTTLAKATLADDARGLSSIFTLSANPAKSDGIALYSEGHIGAITTDGPTYGGGIWLNIDSGATLGADVRALDIGIYERGADCTGGNAYGLAIHLDFDSTNSPAAIYPFRLNCEVSGATPDALIFAANKKVLAVTEGDFPYNNYLKIVVQDGTVYRIPLIKEGAAEFIALHSNAELRFYDNGNYVGFEAPALSADQIWVLPVADASNAAKVLGSNASGTLAWYGHDDLYGFAANEHYLQTAITVVGTIATGVWQGSSIAVTYTDAKCTDATADNTAGNETSHADVVVDGDFASNGILKRTAAGTYGIVTDNSATWNAAQAGHAMLTSLAAMSYVSGSFVSITGANQAAIRTYAQVKADLSLNLVENTAISTYKLDDLAAPDDNTDLDFSTSLHGLVPKGTNVGNFLKDDGTWAASGGGLSDIVDDTTPQLGGDLDLNSQSIDFPSVANVSDCKDEDNMASDSATMLATQQSIKKYVDDNAGGVNVKKGVFTRDMTAASGTQAITGVGFQPTAVIFTGWLVGGSMVVGLEDTTSQGCAYIYTATPTYAGDNTGYSIMCREDAGKYQYGNITTFGADGFTITWTKGGTPAAGTGTMIFLAIG